jgi:hypothetical protein
LEEVQMRLEKAQERRQNEIKNKKENISESNSKVFEKLQGKFELNDKMYQDNLGMNILRRQ